MRSELLTFFKFYQRGFDQLDPLAIASHYATPCSVLDVDGLQVFSNQAGLLEKFSSNCHHMKGMGYSGSEFLVHKIGVLGSTAVSVDLGWRVKLESGLLDFRTLYICRRNENHWQVFSTVVYEGGYDDNDS